LAQFDIKTCAEFISSIVERQLTYLKYASFTVLVFLPNCTQK
jgi:hypothetical protein